MRERAATREEAHELIDSRLYFAVIGVDHRTGDSTQIVQMIDGDPIRNVLFAHRLMQTAMQFMDDALAELVADEIDSNIGSLGQLLQDAPPDVLADVALRVADALGDTEEGNGMRASAEALREAYTSVSETAQSN